MKKKTGIPEDNTEIKDEKEALDKWNKFLITGILEESISVNEADEQRKLSARERNMKKTLIAMKVNIETTKGADKRERLEREYNFLKNSVYDESGNFRSIKDCRKYSDEHFKSEIGGTWKAIKFLSTLSNTSTKEAQNDLKETYPEKWKAASDNFNNEIGRKSEEDDVKKDKDGNILKQEEVTGEDGKKIKVTTHTGPRGGKFYWPDGAPKDAEHKVYVKESKSLMQFLKESLQN